jgi:hypothetical protein
MKPLRHDLHLLSGVYVLDAIDSDTERDRFERHLGRCQSCSSEVRGLREVTTGLAMAAALEPPAAMHGRVLAAARRTRQLPPAADTQPRHRPWPGWWPQEWSRWLPRLALATATAGVVAAVVLGVILAGTQHRLGSAQAQNSAIARVLAAPDVDTGDDHDSAILTQLLEGGHTVLVVLPKWRPSRSDERSREPKLSHVMRVDAKRVTALLHKIDEDAEIVRADELDVPVNGFGAEPDVARPQLVRSDALLPLVGGDAGILVGEMRQENGRTVVVSDPDLLANCGLGRGENAALALALVDSLRGEAGTVLIDETLHGLERVPSVWGELVRAPLKFGSAHVALLFVAAVLAGAARFGKPRPLRGGWREGKEALLENIADLMQRVGHVRVAVGRYFDTTVERLAEYHRAPRTLERPARLDWVAGRLGEKRADELRALAAAAHAPIPPHSSRRSERAAMLALATRIHRFREEVLHGAH